MGSGFQNTNERHGTSCHPLYSGTRGGGCVWTHAIATSGYEATHQIGCHGVSSHTLILSFSTVFFFIYSARLKSHHWFKDQGCLYPSLWLSLCLACVLHNKKEKRLDSTHSAFKTPEAGVLLCLFWVLLSFSVPSRHSL